MEVRFKDRAETSVTRYDLRPGDVFQMNGELFLWSDAATAISLIGGSCVCVPDKCELKRVAGYFLALPVV